MSSIATANATRLKTHSREEAKLELEKYAPLFNLLNANNVRYCLIGGLAVMAHALKSGDSLLRMRSRLHQSTSSCS